MIPGILAPGSGSDPDQSGQTLRGQLVLGRVGDGGQLDEQPFFFLGDLVDAFGYHLHHSLVQNRTTVLVIHIFPHVSSF